MERRDFHGMLEEMVRRAVADQLRAPALGRVPTVRDFFRVWSKTRRQLSLVSVDDDEGRYWKHIDAELGDMLMTEVRPRHIRALLLRKRAEGKLSPRTIRHLRAILSNMFRCAVAEEVVSATPVVLAPGVVPPNIDSAKFIRSEHVFSRYETDQLITARCLPPTRRMLYALKFFTGARHSEIARLLWSQIERREPLWAIHLTKTKTKRDRVVPVHPTLNWILERWRLRGWPATHGRPARPTDLVVPTRNLTPILASNAQNELLRDLARLGFRRRRGHDFRRTLTTFARSDGARDEVLLEITHGPRTDIQGLYTSWPFEVLCAEIAKLRFAYGCGSQTEMPFADCPARHVTDSEEDARARSQSD